MTAGPRSLSTGIFSIHDITTSSQPFSEKIIKELGKNIHIFSGTFMCHIFWTTNHDFFQNFAQKVRKKLSVAYTKVQLIVRKSM